MFLSPGKQSKESPSTLFKDMPSKWPTFPLLGPTYLRLHQQHQGIVRELLTERLPGTFQIQLYYSTIVRVRKKVHVPKISSGGVHGA